MGIKYKHLPITEPFSIYLDCKVENADNNETKSPPAKPKGSMTNEKLIEAINSVEAFDKMYMVRNLDKITRNVCVTDK